MPRFIPKTPEDFHGSHGEEAVFAALGVLDESYTVFHSLAWVGGEGRAEGEADFVLAHPALGLMTIEVKSGGIEYREGSWLQINSRTGYRKRISPYSQAAGSKYALLARLQEFLGFQDMPMVCHAVWFPSVDVSGVDIMPAEAPGAITLDKSSLGSPMQAVGRAFSYWAKALRIKNRLNKEKFARVIEILCPHFRLVPKLGASAAVAEKEYIRLSRQQQAILELLKEQKTAAISGLAGTGKTLLAVEKAKRLAAEGRKVLLLCFNNFLRDWLRDSCAEENISCHNVHSLAYELLQKPELSFDGILMELKQYLVGTCADWPYQDIVIDEGQDIEGGVLDPLAALTKERQGSFYVFYDRNQLVGKNSPAAWLNTAECKLVLHRNCRNTREICQSAYSLIGAGSVASGGTNGIAPKLRFYATPEKLLSLVEKFTRYALQEEIPLEEIAILSAHRLEKSHLTARKIAGLEVTHDLGEKGKLLFTTIRKFKGLEAQAVLLIDTSLAELCGEETRRLLYSGASRAKYLLHIALHEEKDDESNSAALKAILGSDMPASKADLAVLLRAEIKE
jgi:hypothetical protein